MFTCRCAYRRTIYILTHTQRDTGARGHARTHTHTHRTHRAHWHAAPGRALRVHVGTVREQQLQHGHMPNSPMQRRPPVAQADDQSGERLLLRERLKHPAGALQVCVRESALKCARACMLVCARACMLVCARACMLVCARACMLVCARAWVRSRERSSVCICMHACTYTTAHDAHVRSTCAYPYPASFALTSAPCESSIFATAACPLIAATCRGVNLRCQHTRTWYPFTCE